MDKILLLEKYITKAVRKALKEQDDQNMRAEKAMYFIHRFPGLKKILVELMSPAFGRYIADVSLIAPKPTTFNIGLINGQNFTIYYTGKGVFIVKIAGKKYNPINIGESERASQAIADLLELNYAPIETNEEMTSKRDNDIKSDLEAGNTPSGDLSKLDEPLDNPLPPNEPEDEKITPEKESPL
jgi:hypothetical protein